MVTNNQAPVQGQQSSTSPQGGQTGGRKLSMGCIGGVIAAVVVLILIIIAVSVIFGGRNTMVTKELEVDKAWAQVQNVYQRRLDLIPNLANSAKGYMQLEKDIFTAIADARAGIQKAASPSQLESANQGINSFIRDLKVVVEDTPELKASETVRDLMTQLEGTENRVAVERMRFNEAVQDYNTYIRLFPNNIVAGLFGFTPKEFFEALPGAETAPSVNLELNQ
ncbi:MAG: LemA family protein [Actinobacteria bacterium]|nr:LemA family protein [Actinomycetota bacterium]